MNADTVNAAGGPHRQGSAGSGQKQANVRAPSSGAASDTSGLDEPRVLELVRVNEGTHGLAARTRWARSSDGRALLVVEDPYGVENDPLSNAFVFASERGTRRVRMDSVWDVAPSPDWTRLAYGRAYLLRAGESDSLPTEMWAALARRAEMPVADVRRGAFPASGMNAAVMGFAQPGVVDLASGVVRRFPVAAGWRVAWSADGARVVAGTAPTLIADDAPAARWVALDARSGMPVGQLPATARVARVPWTAGPVIGIGMPVDTRSRRVLAGVNVPVESADGWVRVRGRVIGPGVALAATRSGRIIAALVPERNASESEPPLTLAVYVLAP